MYLMNWASLWGLLLMALWVPALVVSLRRFDVLMDRGQTRESLEGLALVWLWVTLAGRCIALPLLGLILFFQGWRLDPLLHWAVTLLVWGTIVESFPSIRADYRAIQQRSTEDAQQSSRQRALELRLRDRVWPWSFAHAVLPFAGVYYAITRRTITPFLWNVFTRFVVLLITSGVLLVFLRLSDGETMMWIPQAVFYVLLVVNVFAGLLPVRAAIRRTQADARHRLEAHG
jgi:hypothetical protein